MQFETRTVPATTYTFVRWDGTPEKLAALQEISGQELWVDGDDRIAVRLGDGHLEVLELGWALYRTDKISLGAAGVGVVNMWTSLPAA